MSVKLGTKSAGAIGAFAALFIILLILALNAAWIVGVVWLIKVLVF